jgi:Methyltransferase domain
LFIDGDHRYEGVKADFENYASLVRIGGLIGFHDIVDGPVDEVGGVPDFWRELKATGVRFVELVDVYRAEGSCGIGVLKKTSH